MRCWGDSVNWDDGLFVGLLVGGDLDVGDGVLLVGMVLGLIWIWEMVRCPLGQRTLRAIDLPMGMGRSGFCTILE